MLSLHVHDSFASWKTQMHFWSNEFETDDRRSPILFRSAIESHELFELPDSEWSEPENTLAANCPCPPIRAPKPKHLEINGIANMTNAVKCSRSSRITYPLARCIGPPNKRTWEHLWCALASPMLRFEFATCRSNNWHPDKLIIFYMKQIMFNVEQFMLKWKSKCFGRYLPSI